MPISFAQIQHIVDTSEFALGPLDKLTLDQQPLENYYLDAYGHVADQAQNHAINAVSVGMVYEAAKVIFARGAGARTFDIASASCEVGSPWECQVLTPAGWAAVFARRHIETEEGGVTDDAVNEALVGRVRYVCELLARVGISDDEIVDLHDVVCHDNEKLQSMLDAALIA